VKTLLLACIVIDATDVVSAHLSGAAGLFSASETWSLKLTAIAALVPELTALVLLAIPLLSLLAHPLTLRLWDSEWLV
jgi:hypothetical protein